MKHLKTYKVFESIDSEINFDKIVEILSEECSEFLDLLEEFKIKGIYRGSSIHENPIIDGLWKFRSFDNRISRDTKSQVSKLLDEGFKKKFGIPLRSRGVFATKDISIAGGYGSVKNKCYRCDGTGEIECYDCNGTGELDCDYCEGFGEINGEDCRDCFGSGKQECLDCNGKKTKECFKCRGDGSYDGKSNGHADTFLFFPKNGFRYFWNPRIDDLFTELRDNTTWYEKDPFFWNSSEQKDFQKIIDGYQEGGIEKVKLQELTFICDEYYMLDLDYYDDFIDYFLK